MPVVISYRVAVRGDVGEAEGGQWLTPAEIAALLANGDEVYCDTETCERSVLEEHGCTLHRAAVGALRGHVNRWRQHEKSDGTTPPAPSIATALHLLGDPTMRAESTVDTVALRRTQHTLIAALAAFDGAFNIDSSREEDQDAGAKLRDAAAGAVATIARQLGDTPPDLTEPENRPV